MADFNKIFTSSPLSIKAAASATLGFNDGLAFSKSKYALENHTLTLSTNTTESVSIFYNNGVASTYEFSTKLYQAGTELPEYDLADKQFTNLTGKSFLVFVNGELQTEDCYTVANNKMSFNYSYTNDMNKFFEVIVYATATPITRITYTQNEINTIDLDNIQLPFTYTAQNTAIFINGEKVSFLAVEKTEHDGSHLDAIKLNIPFYTISSFEIIKFNNDNTDSINFVTESGYLTYGPYDDYSKKIPSLYDTVITFSDQAKSLVDNLRAGFIVKEADAYGELMIVDDTFESPEVKCITIQKFRYSNYTKDKYYLEVPEYTEITKYLAEFDNKYTFLPEILLVFQRLLLDEVNDSIQRLRDMRSIHKVDSVNVNNLLKFLGFNANVKTLNIKQRRELLEELNEFHRIVGTRYSYNLVNILQNNLKLINMEQLFTPYGLQENSKKTIYRYDTKLTNGGTGYKVNDYLKAADGYITIIVDDVVESGPNKGKILSYIQQNSEGYIPLSGDYPLVGGLEGYFNITSPTNQYTHNWIINSSQNCAVGQRLQTASGAYYLDVTAVNNGQITGFTPSVLTSQQAITNVIDSKLYLVTSNMQLRGKISSTNAVNDPAQYELVGNRLTSGLGQNITLQPGKYYIKMSGGGGSGAAVGRSSAADGQTNGYAGESKVYEFTLTTPTSVTYYVGEGGGQVYANSSNSDTVQAGNGYVQGEAGQIGTGKGTTTSTSTGGLSSTQNVMSRHASSGRPGGVAAVTTSTVAYVGGQGGGSSAIVVNGTNPQTGQPFTPFVAKGGNGGNASSEVTGGNGGSGGTTSGTGVAGGGIGLNTWSQPGESGWIEIYRIPQSYTFTIDPQSDISHVPSPQNFTLSTTYIDFTITATAIPGGLQFTPFPVQDYPVINTTYLEMAVDSDTEAYLTIESTPSDYVYNVQLEADHSLLKPGMVFKGTTSGKTFTYTVTGTNNETGAIYGDFEPNVGNDAINKSYIPAIYQTGEGAILNVSYDPNAQKNVDRCYIDFYTRAELVDPKKGEGFVSYYKEDSIDYMSITEGTPNSPQFWVSGDPDIDYGPIANTLEISEPDHDYGYITDKVAGEWVEYWNWERGSIWYPTNHVDLEMKIPVGVDITSYVKTFIEQFYNIASTVVFIHSIIESFYFGNEGDTNSSSGYITTKNDGAVPVKVPSDAKPSFGIATGAPTYIHEMTVTSNPHIQYTKPTTYFGWSNESDNVCYTLFYTPSINDYVYKKINDNFIFDGVVSSVETMLDSGKHITVIRYRNTEGEISEIFKKAEEYDEPIQQKCTLTIHSTPADAQIMIASTSGFPLARGVGTVSYTGNYGTEIIWSVRAGNEYISRAQRRILTKDATKYIILEKANAY